MEALTEQMILLRTKSKDLQSITKLNCWASDLDDVSILKEMPNLEILTLSANNISSLKDVQNCLNLSELYCRNNKIADLREIFYLKKLNNLKILWLEENPCANCDNYRNTVLKNLPNLEKLDSQVVRKEEISKALELGEEFTEPPREINYTSRSTTNSTTELFNSTIYENEMQRLLLPVEEGVSTTESNSITSIDKNLENLVVESSETEINTEDFIDQETLENSTLNLKESSNIDSDLEIKKENSCFKDQNVLSAIFLLIQNLNNDDLDKVIKEFKNSPALAKTQSHLAAFGLMVEVEPLTNKISPNLLFIIQRNEVWIYDPQFGSIAQKTFMLKNAGTGLKLGFALAVGIILLETGYNKVFGKADHHGHGHH
ncbi:unnamed protein product [Brachionus calyciflorus]|uniref:Uncharacterized protein n=1 Tax=Brachionus calyciflorus TaxID=104777 RepID=A0A814BUK5_9BILA|nr:unnamed protein product [Brachionus calyciflorus]